MLPPELLKAWQVSAAQGPNERKVLEEFNRLPPEVAEAELGIWLITRLGALLKDAQEEEEPPDFSSLENPS